MSEQAPDRPRESERDPRGEDPASTDWERPRERGRRKERVLHTRVSEALAHDIRRIADDLRVPASNLVRNVLEEVFDVVESVSDDVGDLFGEMLDEAEGARDRVLRARTRAKTRRRRQRRSGEWGDARDRAAWEAAERELDEAERRAAAGVPPPPPIDWHVVEDGRALGPLRPDELLEGVRSGRFGPDTRVWSAGMGDWQRAGEVASLASLFAPPPVPEEG